MLWSMEKDDVDGGDDKSSIVDIPRSIPVSAVRSVVHG
jgi:hypothetical protein